MKIDTFFIFNQFVNYKFATNQSPTSLVLYAFDPFGAKSSVTTPCSNDLLTTALMASASAFNPKASSNIIAADNIVANGLAIFNPVACGYDP